MIEISNNEKKRRQYKKELKSLRNKMGSNIVWFDSLPKSKQYDILFKWKSEKYIKKSLENYLSGKSDSAYKFWFLLVFQMWYEKWMK